MLDLASRLPRIPPEVKAGLVGALVAVVGLASPPLVGGGDSVTQPVLQGSQPLWTLVGVLVVRWVLGPVCYSVGNARGPVRPAARHRGRVGALVASGGNSLRAQSPLSTSAFAVVGMSAFFAAVVRGPDHRRRADRGDDRHDQPLGADGAGVHGSQCGVPDSSQRPDLRFPAHPHRGCGGTAVMLRSACGVPPRRAAVLSSTPSSACGRHCQVSCVSIEMRPSVPTALPAGRDQRSTIVTAVVLLGATLLLTVSLVLLPVTRPAPVT